MDELYTKPYYLSDISYGLKDHNDNLENMW